MNYGECQERAEYLVKSLRGKQTPTYTDSATGQEYTPDMMATEIENETPLGRSFVAVAGFVLYALQAGR